MPEEFKKSDEWRKWYNLVAATSIAFTEEPSCIQSERYRIPCMHTIWPSIRSSRFPVYSHFFFLSKSPRISSFYSRVPEGPRLIKCKSALLFYNKATKIRLGSSIFCKCPFLKVKSKL